MMLSDLVHAWREEAEHFRRRGVEDRATLIESLADDLEVHLREAQHETVNLTDAAKLSGYSTRHLRRLLRDGELQNVGRKNAPEIRVGDLPRKAGCDLPTEPLPVLRISSGGSDGRVEEGRDGRGVRVHGVGLGASGLSSPSSEAR